METLGIVVHHKLEEALQYMCKTSQVAVHIMYDIYMTVHVYLIHGAGGAHVLKMIMRMSMGKMIMCCFSLSCRGHYILSSPTQRRNSRLVYQFRIPFQTSQSKTDQVWPGVLDPRHQPP